MVQQNKQQTDNKLPTEAKLTLSKMSPVILCRQMLLLWRKMVCLWKLDGVFMEQSSVLLEQSSVLMKTDRHGA